MNRPTRRPLARLAATAACALSAIAAAAGAQTQLTLAPTQDTYVQDIFPTQNFGASDTLLIGRGSFFGLGLIRTLVQFDLAALPHANVHKATFEAWEYKTEPAAGTVNTQLLACTSAWSEATATWNLQPSFNSAKTWATAGVGDDFAPFGYIGWDVTSLVHEQAAGNLPSLGWLIKSASESAGVSRLGYFWSREYPVDPAKRPRLQVELYDLDLDIGPLTAGVPEPMLVERADPGSNVFCFLDLTGPGATPIVPLGIVLELHDPMVFSIVPASAAGEAAFTLRVPASASGLHVWVQAAAVGKLSNLASLVMP